MKKKVYNLFQLTVFINVWIPKGGVKVSGIPITFGIVAYLLLLLVFGFYVLLKGCFKKSRVSLFIVVNTIVFGMRFIIAQVNIKPEIGILVAYITPLCIFPLIYIICQEIIETKSELDRLVNIIKYGFIFVSIYGMLQFLFGIDSVVIPGVTVNYSDYITGTYWYLAKSNHIGEGASKIISTYQNGNIFGVNLILMFPLVFESVFKNNNKRAFTLLLLFLFAGVMTLSRTAWVGLIIYIFIRFIFGKINNVLRVTFIMLLAIVVIYIYHADIPQLNARITQTNISNINSLSGRVPGALALLSSTKDNILSILIGPYGWFDYVGGAYEMTYVAIYALTGILGLGLWIVPILLSLIKTYMNRANKYAKGAFLGLFVWCIIAFVEGAFWLPPTSLNLWIIISIGMVSTRVKDRNLCFQIISV